MHGDISATRLSQGDPVGFPPHPRGWFSIIVYLLPKLLTYAHSPYRKQNYKVNKKLYKNCYGYVCLLMVRFPSPAIKADRRS